MEVARKCKGSTVAEIQTGYLYVRLDKFSDHGRKSMIASQRRTHLNTSIATPRSIPSPKPMSASICWKARSALPRRHRGRVRVQPPRCRAFMRRATPRRAKNWWVRLRGGAGPATAWALASGSWAGHAAVAFANRYGNSLATRKVKAVGGAGIRPNEEGARGRCALSTSSMACSGECIRWRPITAATKKP